MGIDKSSDEWFEDDDTHASDSDADKGESRKADGPAADLGENNGVCNEAEVENAVDLREVSLMCTFQHSVSAH